MMFFLSKVCNNSEILSVILFIRQIMRIVLFIVPMILIVMVTIDFSKNVIGNKDTDSKKNVIMAIRRIIVAVIIFLMPTIVDLFCSLVGEASFITGCWSDASIEKVTDLRNKELSLKMEEELEQKNSQKLYSFLPNARTIVVDGSSNGGTTGSGSGGRLPTDSKYYPMNGKKDGKSLSFLEFDGKYLTDSEIDDINKFLKDSVNSTSDPGTKVALAGWALIYSLSEKGLKLHYMRGGTPNGGYASFVVNGSGVCNGKKGFCKNWGRILNSTAVSHICASQGIINSPKDCSSGKTKFYSGLQCDGFVKWALTYACQRGGWGNQGATINIQEYKKGKEFDTLEPGDLIGSVRHIALFIKKTGDKYLIAEANSGRGGGAVIFHKHTESDLKNHFWIYKMKPAYDKYCK